MLRSPRCTARVGLGVGLGLGLGVGLGVGLGLGLGLGVGLGLGLGLGLECCGMVCIVGLLNADWNRVWRKKKKSI